MSSGPHDPMYPHEGQPPVPRNHDWAQQPYPQQPYQAPQGYYGTPQQYGGPQGYPGPGYGYPPQPRPTNGVGIAGFVTGVLGLLLCWAPWLGILLSLVGVALSGVAIPQGKKKGASTGLAIAGLVCGILGLIVSIIVTIAVYALVNSSSAF